MASHSSILAWKSPWTEEPGGLQSMGLHDWACVHKGGGRWVGSNKVVELKKKKNSSLTVFLSVLMVRSLRSGYQHSGGLPRTLVLAFRWLSSCHCYFLTLTGWGENSLVSLLLFFFFSSYKGTNPTTRAPLSRSHLNFIISQWSHLQILSHWGIMASYINLAGEYNSDHSIIRSQW